MLTKRDLNEIEKLITPLKDELVGMKRDIFGMKRDIFAVKEDIKKIEKDQRVIVKFFDNEHLELRKRVDQMEKQLRLS